MVDTFLDPRTLEEVYALFSCPTAGLGAVPVGPPPGHVARNDKMGAESGAQVMERQEFVILSYPRSGTHWLRTALESNPAIRCQAELFNSNNWGLPYPLSTPVEDILEGIAFRETPPEIAAVGFVLHAFQPWSLEAFPGLTENPNWEGLWPWLAQRSGLRVVHLVRRNLLRRHLSHRLMVETDFWHAWDPDRVDRVTHLGGRPGEHQIGRRPENRPTLELDPDDLARDFAEVERWTQEARRKLAPRKALEVAYEDLVAHFDRHSAEIQRFLGVEPQSLTGAMVKLERRPLRRAIRNYDALARHFAGTSWGGFFDDSGRTEGGDTPPSPPPDLAPPPS